MLAPEDVLQNRYRIVRRLGHGGMGAVYEAIDRRVKSTVAIKETFAMTEEGRTAFRLEAERLANLDHEVFPKVSDYFDEGEGLYLVMQLIRGEDLAERLNERIKYHEGPFSPTKVLEWADQLLDALEDLHKYRPPIIHRDIKPSNLKVTQRGKIILLDFGIAKGAAGQMSTPMTDGSIGAATPYFAPLEQILRIDPSSIKTLSTISQEAVEKILHKGTDPRSDLYALGATLYNLMTGELPDDSRLRAMAIWADRPDPLQPADKVNSQVPQAVSAVLMQAMALDRSERPADASTMRRALREAVGASVEIGLTIPPPEELERQRREEARRKEQAEVERRRREEEERQRAEEEKKRREAEAEAAREKEEEAARRAAEQRLKEEGERKRQEAETLRQREAEAEAETLRHKREAAEPALKVEEETRRQRVEREEANRLAAEREAARREEERRSIDGKEEGWLVGEKTFPAPAPEPWQPASSTMPPPSPKTRSSRSVVITLGTVLLIALLGLAYALTRHTNNSANRNNAAAASPSLTPAPSPELSQTPSIDTAAEESSSQNINSAAKNANDAGETAAPINKTKRPDNSATTQASQNSKPNRVRTKESEEQRVDREINKTLNSNKGKP